MQKDKDLPQGNFGEGCTLFDDQVYQMTYREGRVFVFDKNTLGISKEMKMPKQMEEGWGLTHDDQFMYSSDGTNRIFKINPSDFSVIDIIEVKDKHGKAIHYINELELVGDYIYGNVLPLSVIIKINKSTGLIEKVYDFKKLYDMQMSFVGQNKLSWDSSNNVMNGIAFRRSTNTFLITGKEYNFIFEVKLL